MKPCSLLSPLTLLTLSRPILAATAQFCTGFEGPSSLWGDISVGINITSHYENTSVLVLRSNDFAPQYEKTVDFDVMMPVEDGTYPFCPEDGDYPSNPYCDDDGVMFDSSAIMVPRFKWMFLVGILDPDTSAFYPVPASGVYCVLLHQKAIEAAEVVGVDIEVSHFYGTYPLTLMLPLKLAVAAVLLWLFHCCLLPHLFPNTPLEHRYGFWKLVKVSLVGKLALVPLHAMMWLMVIEIEGSSATGSFFHNPFSLAMLSPWFLLDQILSLSVIGFFYGLWNGIAGKTSRGFFFVETTRRGVWVFASRRAYWSVVATGATAAAGQILTHHFVESESLSVLMIDIYASLLALVYTSLHKLKIVRYGVDLKLHSKERETAHFSKDTPSEYILQLAAKEPDFEYEYMEPTKWWRDESWADESDSIAYLTFNLLLRWYVILFSYGLLEAGILKSFLITLQYVLGMNVDKDIVPYFINRHMALTYDHLIWLNLAGNSLASIGWMSSWVRLLSYFWPQGSA